MTQREFFTAIANGTVNDETKKFAEEKLAKFIEEDKVKDSKREANLAIGTELLGKMEAGKEYFVKDFVAMFGGVHNSSKISYILRELIADKVVVKDTTPKTYVKK